ncbi:MAG TPA: aspartate racemase [Sulfurospirillum sp. UBA12182]|jgi:aspartate racemase|nr:MAG TPA: aspartate racemase [Sulfurospirillum sp. UBA12182]
MKTIGLLGGMSWESTLTYYKLLNLGVKQKLGGLHSAKIVLYSVDFEEIELLQREGRWDEAGEILAKNVRSLELAGADFILICTNTMHKVIDIIQKNIKTPIIHIAEATAFYMQKEGYKKAILLGTRFSMQENFIKGVLEKNNIQVVTPNSEEICEIDRIIFSELVLGKISPQSKQIYLSIIDKIYQREKQIDSVILGCTEIGLLLQKEDTFLKIFDTTVLHVNKALDLAI